MPIGIEGWTGLSLLRPDYVLVTFERNRVKPLLRFARNRRRHAADGQFSEFRALDRQSDLRWRSLCSARRLIST